mmetsp:Transcript_140971/g.450771  ORF Transcript_140971/g.450771 Transcript_140971/m.450771 type:complete len:346 (-) Transcript_140971:1491-2528(-)
MPIGQTKGDLYPRAAQIVMMGWKQRNKPPSSSIFPNIGWTWILASFSPNGVKVAPEASETAPKLYSKLTACCTISWGGGLTASLRKSAGGPRCKEATSKQSSSRGARNISGSSYSCMASHCRELYRRNHLPGRHRPERPLRWKPLAFEYHTVLSAETLESLLKNVLRDRPGSMTKTTSSTVMDVSARMVAMITLRFPVGGGWKIACCSAVGILECNGCTCNSRLTLLPWSLSIVLRISPQPGMKMRMAPSSPEAWIISTMACTKSKSNSSGDLVCAHAMSLHMSKSSLGISSETRLASAGKFGKGPWEKAETFCGRTFIANSRHCASWRAGRPCTTSSRKSSSIG